LERGVHYSPIERHAISEQDLEAVAAWQGTDFRQGDVLLIRSGFVKWYKQASPEDRRKGTVEGAAWAGVEGTQSSVEWFWNRHFAAVGGDANVFEAWPARDERWRKCCSCPLPCPENLFFVLRVVDDHPQAFTTTSSRSLVCRWEKCLTWMSWQIGVGR